VIGWRISSPLAEKALRITIVTAVSSLRFRTASIADLEAIVTLVESAYRGDASRAGWTTEADLLDGQRTDSDEVRELIGSEDSVIVLAFRDDVLVGSVVLRDEGGTCYFGMLAVSPALQNEGVGKALIERAEEIAQHQLHARAMRITVIAQRDELIAWYERRGYARTGEYEPFPYGDPRFGRPRRGDLVFVVMRKTF
jgi:ribosomal protein S18 acetylase RimI-like enzyme